MSIILDAALTKTLTQTGQRKVLTPWTPLCNSPAAASMTLTNHGPTAQSFYLKATVSGGTTGSGAVTVTGTRVGTSSPQSETLTFTANGSLRSVYQYTAASITSIATSGLVDEATKPTVKVDAVDVGNNVLNSSTWTNFSCRWEATDEGYWASPGVWVTYDSKIITRVDIPEGDFIRKGSSGEGNPVKKAHTAVWIDGVEKFYVLFI